MGVTIDLNLNRKIKEHNSNNHYIIGDTVVYNNKIYKSLSNNSGSFSQADWIELSADQENSALNNFNDYVINTTYVEQLNPTVHKYKIIRDEVDVFFFREITETQDRFYSSYSDGVLDGLIVSRGED